MNEDKDWIPARKKPVEVEFRGPFTDPKVVETIEGDYEVDEEYIEEHGGFVIIRGVEGEVYPCGLDIFRDTYDVLERDVPLDPAGDDVESPWVGTDLGALETEDDSHDEVSE